MSDRCFIILASGCCNSCEECACNCPTGALDCCGENSLCYDNEMCIGCGSCIFACPCMCLDIVC